MTQDPALFLEEELYWRESLKDLPQTELEWLEVFPDEKDLVETRLKQQISDAKNRVKVIKEDIVKNRNSYATTDPTKHNELDWINELLLKNLSTEQATIRSLAWQLQSLNPKKAHPGQITEQDIVEAKKVSITNFITGRKQGNRMNAKCPFHSEKTASFVIYLNQNSWYCFGACGKGGSVVDFIMERDQLEFLDAVKLLLNKP